MPPGRVAPPLTHFTVEDRGYETPCHIWQGSINKGGYGNITINYVRWAVHRLIWTLRHGPIPARHHIHHKCEQPPCIRLDHLECLEPAEHKWRHQRKQNHNPYGEHPDHLERFDRAMQAYRKPAVR